MRGTALVPVLLVGLIAGCGGDASEETPAPAETTGCREAVPPAAEERGAEKPTRPLPGGVTYVLTFRTSCGTFAVTLHQATAPATAASLVSLARAGYFDGTVFHRIVPGYVIQGGDPTQSGAGGPGYSTRDVPPADTRYTKGVVAMAKAAAEPPGTAGSQFFVVTSEDAGLAPEYAVVGSVTSGLDVVDTIGRLGDPVTEEPTQPVVVERVTVAER
jgi:cyclophilin family peptidyl-prolyl cis-trans isomerase